MLGDYGYASMPPDFRIFPTSIRPPECIALVGIAYIPAKYRGLLGTPLVPGTPLQPPRGAL